MAAAVAGDLGMLPPDVIDALLRPVGPIFQVDVPMATESETHTAVYVLCILMVLAISPLLFQKGFLAFFTAVVYLASLSVVKVLVKTTEQNGFAQPYSLTIFHMLTTAVISGCWGRPKKSEALRVFPVGVAVGSSLLLNNTALLYGGVAFVAMVGCSTPAITFFFQLILGRSTCSLKAFLPILVLCGGSILCVTGEKSSSLLGLILGSAAAVMRATKAILIHECILTDIPPISVVFWGAAWTVGLMLPFAYFIEGHQVMNDLRTASAGGKQALVASAVAAACLNISQNYTVQITGPLQLNVIGNLNLIVVILIAVSFLHEIVTPVQYIGVSMLVAGAITSRINCAPIKDDAEKVPLVNQMCASSKSYSAMPNSQSG